jgi:hypothetical protein
LAGGIPQSQADGIAINHYTGRVVIESEGLSARGGYMQLFRIGGKAIKGGTNTVGMYSPGKALLV